MLMYIEMINIVIFPRNVWFRLRAKMSWVRAKSDFFYMHEMDFDVLITLPSSSDS